MLDRRSDLVLQDGSDEYVLSEPRSDVEPRSGGQILFPGPSGSLVGLGLNETNRHVRLTVHMQLDGNRVIVGGGEPVVERSSMRIGVEVESKLLRVLSTVLDATVKGVQEELEIQDVADDFHVRLGGVKGRKAQLSLC